eukprot:7428233-Pyramimonas_sp.AAC.1
MSSLGATPAMAIGLRHQAQQIAWANGRPLLVQERGDEAGRSAASDLGLHAGEARQLEQCRRPQQAAG